MHNRAGGVVDDLIVYYFDETWFRLVLNAGRADADLAWLAALAQAAAPEIRPRRDLALIAVQGPQARERVWQVMPEARAASAALMSFHGVQLGDMVVAGAGGTGEGGVDRRVA